MFNAFSQIRLDNYNLTGNNGRLFFGVSGVVYQQETGQFYPKSNNQEYVTSGNLYVSGSNLYNLTVGLSGQVNDRMSVFGVRTLTVTGTQYSGNLTLTGIGTTEISVLGGNIIRVSGAAGSTSYDDTYTVKTTGNQYISGEKTFVSGHITGQFRYSATSIPSATGSAGLSGQFSWDQNFLYVCVTNNYWKRAVLSDF